MQKVLPGQIMPLYLTPLSHTPPGRGGSREVPHPTSHLSWGRLCSPPCPLQPLGSQTTHKSEAHFSLTSSVSCWDVPSSCPGSAQGALIFLSLLIHLLLLPAVICSLQLAALNTAPEILTPKTKYLSFCCCSWESRDNPGSST